MNRASQRDLHLNEDFQQQKIEWNVQRIAWPLLALVLLAVAAGLLGQGPVARADLGSQEAGVTMEYRRFVRQVSPDTLELRLWATSERVRLHIDGRYLDAVELTRVFPEPEQVLSGTEVATLEFAGRPGAWTAVHVEIKPQKVGRVEGWVAVDGHPRQPFSQFVYP